MKRIITVHKSVWEDHTTWHCMTTDESSYSEMYIYHDQPEDAIMCNLHVLDNMRGKGIGRQMQEYREEIARENGAERLCLWISNDAEDWRREWYEREGYKEIGDGPYENTKYMAKEINTL